MFGYPSSRYAGIPLLSGERTLFLTGKIDRVDVSGEYSRVIDYKTGSSDTGEESYYTGRKLQLGLYLTAASRGGKPAGAYYFPAKAGFSKAGEEPFRMEGFTAGEDEVVRLSDKNVQPGGVSRYINASYGKKKNGRLQGEDFSDFLYYSVLVSRGCAEEISRGCIAPSPTRAPANTAPTAPCAGMTSRRGRARRKGDGGGDRFRRAEKEGRQMSVRTPTPEQQAAIDAAGEVLVSASAGSGKTFVMVEKIISLILSEKADVSSVLAVTFTNLAASEMKERLRAALVARLNSEKDAAVRARLRAQLGEVATADICTVHGLLHLRHPPLFL